MFVDRVSRQRRWQIKQVEMGRCMLCGQPLSDRSRCHCERHRLEYNARRRKERKGVGQ
jgi:hypothetical protein